MPWIRPQIEKKRAAELFDRSGLWNRIPFLSSGKRRRNLELVWLPHYRITASWVTDVDTARERSISCLVCGWSGMPSRLVADPELLAEAPTEAPCQWLEPKLRLDQALALGRQYLLKALQTVRARPAQTIESRADPAIWRYPCWVETFERRSGNLDLRVLDAVTAKKGGVGMKQAVLSDLLNDPLAVSDPTSVST